MRTQEGCMFASTLCTFLLYFLPGDPIMLLCSGVVLMIVSACNTWNKFGLPAADLAH